MTSLVNPYFNQNKATEQSLFNSINAESIQIMGSTYHYLPREVQVEDLVLGEDVVSRFGLSVPVEMYLVDAQGFQGDKEMFTKFGLNIQNSYRLVVNKNRWEAEVGAMFDNGTTFNVLLESGAFLVAEGNQVTPSKLLGLAHDTNEATFDIANYIRPREGDLIFDPITNFLMEIKFVDHDVEFFALGKNYQYYLSCEAFQYQNEIIETGVADIDLFESNSRDELAHQFLMEDGSKIVLESGAYLIQEEGNWQAIIRPDVRPVITAETESIQFTVENIFGL